MLSQDVWAGSQNLGLTDTGLCHFLDTIQQHDPLEIMQYIHGILNKPKPGAIVAPHISALLIAFETSADKAIARSEITTKEQTKTAIDQASDLQSRYPPALKVYAAIGKARKKLAAHYAAFDQNEVDSTQKPRSENQNKSKTVAGNNTVKSSAKARKHIGFSAPRPNLNFDHPAIRTKYKY